ncbi:MAG: phosphatidate cytidylyltransferase [Gammaproteobacteria bacterium]|jgi:phosphatidate cytidylyltransferase|nr:phosphatidate cytidylyltransferase [Gammaproteobacteria bacterium]
MLKSRVITALILAPITLGSVFFLPGPWFAVFIGLVVLMGAWEWTAMMHLMRFSQRLAYVLFLLLILLLTGKYLTAHQTIVFALAAIWWLLATGLVVLYPRFTRCWRNRVSKGVVGLLVLIPTWLALVQVREMAAGPWLIMYLLLIVWGADTGAYFAGKRYGKRKLMPRVSPAKSWAGVGGAVVTVLLVSFLAKPYFDFASHTMFGIYLLALLVVFASVVGDLLESMFKRHCGIKDSGSLLPGHGGVMDRIDSLTAAAPVFALCLISLGA